jgi:hypothetical protein
MGKTVYWIRVMGAAPFAQVAWQVCILEECCHHLQLVIVCCPVAVKLGNLQQCRHTCSYDAYDSTVK